MNAHKVALAHMIRRGIDRVYKAREIVERRYPGVTIDVIIYERQFDNGSLVDKIPVSFLVRRPDDDQSETCRVEVRLADSTSAMVSVMCKELGDSGRRSCWEVASGDPEF